MTFAILAAGEGSRLRNEGIPVPKPLVRVGGETLLERLLRIFMQCGASEVVVVCNDLHPEVDAALQRLEREGLHGQRLPLRHVVQTTPSSMHSMYALRHLLRQRRFILTTVDTFFSEAAFARYVEAFRQSPADGMMAVTDFIDDEKPLYVQTVPTAQGLSIQNFLDADPDHACQYISAGIYGLSDRALDTLERCISEGQSRMRNFQRALIADGLRLEAYPLGRVTDIDHATDIPPTIVGIARAKRFSPGSTERDEAILQATLQALEVQGCATQRVGEEAVLKRGQLPPADLYLSMARDAQTLKLLRQLARPVLNVPAAVGLATRRYYGRAEAQVTTPAPLWLKRTDCCATTPDDVLFCPTEADFMSAVAELTQQRGVAPSDILCQPHYEGDVLKFYGVRGTDFFHVAPPQAGAKDKFGRAQAAPAGYIYNKEKLRALAEALASDMGCDIYGGDVVVSADGELHIIDFNDWPSFSPCVAEAAQAIAQRALHQLRAPEPLPAGFDPLPRAIAFDYGATLDTRGEHWSRVIFRGYEAEQVGVTWEQFWEAYRLTERLLGNEPIIRPSTTFRETLSIKVERQFGFLAEAGALEPAVAIDLPLRERIVARIYAETVEVTRESRQLLLALQRRGVPMVLVTNFYGNVETVLREFGLDSFFLDVIESAVVGIRKPDPRLWQLAIDRLTEAVPGLQPQDVLVVGDSMEKDILPAQSLGCRGLTMYQ